MCIRDRPGEIRGIFYHSDDPLGSLEKNSSYGVFGLAYHPMESPLYDQPLAVGTREQVELGDAYILSTLSNNEIKRFDIEIEKIEDQDSPADKSMVIRVTDEELLEESGGIAVSYTHLDVYKRQKLEHVVCEGADLAVI